MMVSTNSLTSSEQQAAIVYLIEEKSLQGSELLY